MLTNENSSASRPSPESKGPSRFDIIGSLRVLEQLRSRGQEFPGARETIELLNMRQTPGYAPPFTLLEAKVTSHVRPGASRGSREAVVKVTIGTETSHSVCEGNGPVHAVDNALKKALRKTFPEIDDVVLADLSVEIINPAEATGASTRVSIKAKTSERTEPLVFVGASEDIVEASVLALCDLYEHHLCSRLQSRNVETDSIQRAMFADASPTIPFSAY